MNKLHFASLLLLYFAVISPPSAINSESIYTFAHNHQSDKIEFPWTKKPKRIVHSKLATANFERPGDSPFLLQETLQKEALQNDQRNIKNAALERAVSALNTYTAIQEKINKLLTAKSLGSEKSQPMFNWQLKRYQKRLRKSFQNFIELYQQSTWIELVLIEQKRHNPALAKVSSQLRQPNGEVLPIYVDIRKNISPRSNQTNIVGVTLFARENELFSSASAYLRRAFPHLLGRKNAIQIYLSDTAKPAILSHELGHIYYLTNRWDAYQDYIKQKGPNYQRGGHGPDDPCGKAAMLAEAGKFPNLAEL